MISLYLSHSSWLHRWPAGIKLGLLAGCSMMILPVVRLDLMIALLLATGLLYTTLGDRGWRHLEMLRPLLPFLAVIMLFHLWAASLYEGSVSVLRLVIMFLLANLITLTTRMSDMMAALQPVFRPFQWLGLSARSLALAVALMVRFAPVLVMVMNNLDEAWRARGGRKHKWRLIVPLIIQAIRLSDHVAEALTARGGSSGITVRPQKNQEITNNEQR
ncbi:energy-coupling factor transporter transmembrane component T family protein [Neptunomonas qingdaonensis]|uniref:Biotin transport system permease protein n=1 Tax=Neptunomonas qingdaonensis TaxID=1045558 RepID=A0A1I2LRR1_9GAMM|nr:energy-coupling factor transporter transmembrane component T [Neptunomonas qingdaonensis]SFF82152.1 biotin transport system permease protein [Neptunomonas qingdaonensis]